MLESLKKLMYVGLGAAVMSRDRIKQGIDDMVSQGDMSADEGRKLYDDFISRAEEETEKINDRIRSQVRKYVTDAGVADRTQIDALTHRIDHLEMKINQLMAAASVTPLESAALEDQSD